MSVKAYIIETSGIVRRVTLTDHEWFDDLRQELQGYLAHLNLSDVVFWCDEDGRDRNLAYNEVATDLLRLTGRGPGERLVGPVAVTGSLGTGDDPIGALPPEWQVILSVMANQSLPKIGDYAIAEIGTLTWPWPNPNPRVNWELVKITGEEPTVFELLNQFENELQAYAAADKGRREVRGDQRSPNIWRINPEEGSDAGFKLTLLQQ